MAVCIVVLQLSAGCTAQTARPGTGSSADIDQPLTVSLSSIPDFDSRVAELLGQWAPSALKCKPYLAIVSHEGPRTVVAYMIAFELRRSDGSIASTEQVAFMYPTAVSRADDGAEPVRPGRAFRPGEARVVGLSGFEVADPQGDNSWLDQLCSGSGGGVGVSDFDVAITAVIEDDGGFRGDKDHRLLSEFEMYVDVTQDLYRRVAAQLAAGASMDEVFDWVQMEFDAARRLARTSPSDRRLFLLVEAAGDLRRWRRELGDEAFRSALPNAIRSTEFRLIER